MTAGPRFDIDEIKRAAAGRWDDVLCNFGFRPEQLNGSHGPCPKCHGTDRFRSFNDGTGAVHCGQCFDRRNGDGIAAVQWLNDWRFGQTVKAIGEFLNLRPTTDRAPTPTQPHPTHQPKQKKSNEQLRQMFSVWQDQSEIQEAMASHAGAKPPITVDAMLAARAEVAHFPPNENGMACIAFPAEIRPGETVGYILRRIDGQDFPAFKSLQQRKTHMLGGSADGWVIPGGFERLAQARVVWRVEGVPDCLSLFPLLPDDHAVVTNICGCKSIPDNTGIFAGKVVYSIGDADEPGQIGAAGFAMRMLGTAEAVRAPKLQFPVEKSRGQDLRDWLNSGGDFPQLLDIANTTPAFVSRIFVVDNLDSGKELRQFGFITNDIFTSPSRLAEYSEVIFCETDKFKDFKQIHSQVAKLNGNIRFKTMNIAGLAGWLEHRDAMEPSQIEKELCRLVDDAPEVRPETSLRIRSAGELVDEFPHMRRSVIQDLLRIGEVMNIISAPKFGKSWLVLGLVMCVACGKKWLNKFWTTRGKVLLVDNELHCETLAERIRKVGDALGLRPEEYRDAFSCVTLRGDLQDLTKLSEQLKVLKPGSFDLVVLDAWYRLQPSGSDENSNGDVTQLYNLLDSVAHRIGCSFVCVHHSSKGSQAGKSVTDIGSGAGAQSRAPDSHMTLRAHEEDGAVVVEAAVRSWKPMPPFCMRWEHPGWSIAEELDPKDLKDSKPRKKAEQAPDDAVPPDLSGMTREQAARLRVLDAYELAPEGDTESSLAATSGMNTKVFKPINAALRRDCLVIPCEVQKSRAKYPGFKLSDAGISELRQLRQVRQNSKESELSDNTPTILPPFRGGDGCRSTSDGSELRQGLLSELSDLEPSVEEINQLFGNQA